MISSVTLRERLTDIRLRVTAAAEKKGRDPAEVTILAATKSVPANVVELAIQLGVTDIGENRLQEAAAKFPEVPSLGRVRTHYIGRLQSNKAKHAVVMFSMIQSVDSLKLARIIDRHAADAGKVMPILVEVNVGDEESKSGITPEETLPFCNQLLRLPHIRVEGIMGIPPQGTDEETREYFRTLKDLQKRLGMPVLSMGMSSDFEVAVEEGSTMVRVGTALFGPREQYGGAAVEH
ncbi:MAG: YggS family pyridoxal phosphate-dependent enzyme [archaeon]